jgi:hypothetical protein
MLRPKVYAFGVKCNSGVDYFVRGITIFYYASFNIFLYLMQKYTGVISVSENNPYDNAQTLHLPCDGWSVAGWLPAAGGCSSAKSH